MLREAELIEIGRFDPSSRMCSKCGNIRRDLKLSDRIYHCNVCDLIIDRDLNAAINILNMGFIKVGEVIPELTPVESATAAELLKGGLRVATLLIRNLQPFRVERMSVTRFPLDSPLYFNPQSPENPESSEKSDPRQTHSISLILWLFQ